MFELLENSSKTSLQQSLQSNLERSPKSSSKTKKPVVEDKLPIPMTGSMAGDSDYDMDCILDPYCNNESSRPTK